MINQLRQLISQRQHNDRDGNQYAGNLNGFSRFPAGLRLVIFCTVLGKAGSRTVFIGWIKADGSIKAA